MVEVVTDDGREWISQKLFGNNDEELFYVAVGDGTQAPTASDSALTNELYRASKNDSNCVIEPTTGVGRILFRITISGGTEVPAGSGITEFGVFSSSSDTLLYHEVRAAVTLESGDRKTFEGSIDITDA